VNPFFSAGITAISSGTPIYPTNSNSTSSLYNISAGTGTISGAQLNREVTGREDVPLRYVFTCNLSRRRRFAGLLQRRLRGSCGHAICGHL
jgi:hypothetical protein